MQITAVLKGKNMKSRKFLVVLSLVMVALLSMQSLVQAQDATPEATAATGADQFTPTSLNQIVDALTTATQGKVADPSQVRLAIVVNVLSPFWTAAAIGEQRASSELGAPVVFEAPDKNDSIASQQSILESM